MVQKIVNKKTNVNAKGENGEMPLYLTCENNLNGIISIVYAWYSISYLFVSCFINHKLYDFVWFFTIIQILCENYMPLLQNVS